MANIAFIGLGHMGLPMAKNLLKNGHTLKVFDLMEAALQEATAAGAKAAQNAADAAQNADFILTMLPESRHVQSVYEGPHGLFEKAPKNSFFIECSTIDIGVSRDLHQKAAAFNHTMIDAPVSGGTAGAAAGTLTFMVGGTEAAFQKAEPLLKAMGKNIFHTGIAGSGQGVKMCNNMMLAMHMIITSEAFVLAKNLGIDAQKLFDVANTSSGQSWSLSKYCPEPGMVPEAPSNRDYTPGFTAAMMLKDLGIALRAAESAGTNLKALNQAHALYEAFCASHGQKDFSAIIKSMGHS